MNFIFISEAAELCAQKRQAAAVANQGQSGHKVGWFLFLLNQIKTKDNLDTKEECSNSRQVAANQM